jgi:multidrug resistance efflux pump
VTSPLLTLTTQQRAALRAALLDARARIDDCQRTIDGLQAQVVPVRAALQAAKADRDALLAGVPDLDVAP